MGLVQADAACVAHGTPDPRHLRARHGGSKQRSHTSRAATTTFPCARFLRGPAGAVHAVWTLLFLATAADSRLSARPTKTHARHGVFKHASSDGEHRRRQILSACTVIIGDTVFSTSVIAFAQNTLQRRSIRATLETTEEPKRSGERTERCLAWLARGRLGKGVGSLRMFGADRWCRARR